MSHILSNYYKAYGDSLTNRDVKDNKLEIILPPIPSNNQQTAPVAKPLSKKERIIARSEEAKRKQRIADETERLKNIDSEIKQKLSKSYSDAINYIDESLPILKEDEVRLQLIQRKFELQRSYLRVLREKTNLTLEEQSKLELLQVAYFATMSVIVKLEGLKTERKIFQKKKIFMEELIDRSPLDFESWYRFQMKTINSRLPRREQNQPDDRVRFFSDEQWNPDPWQVEFLNVIDQQQSVIIVAPTASGKTYASYYAMHKVLSGIFGSNGICVYVAPTKALVNQVAGKFPSLNETQIKSSISSDYLFENGSCIWSVYTRFS